MAALTAHAWVTADRDEFYDNNSEYTFTYVGDTKTITNADGSEIAFYIDATGDIPIYSAVAFNVDGTTSVLSGLTQNEELMIALIDSLT